MWSTWSARAPHRWHVHWSRNRTRALRFRHALIATARLRSCGPRAALLLIVEAVGKSRGGVSLAPDLVSGAIVGATVRRRASGQHGGEAVAVELEQVVGCRDDPP